MKLANKITTTPSGLRAETFDWKVFTKLFMIIFNIAFWVRINYMLK